MTEILDQSEARQAVDAAESKREATVSEGDAVTPPERKLGRSVVLVGLMGAGKSTVGRRLAQAIGAPFYDSDDEIERAAGMTVADIFDRYGEAHFRDRERRVIERLLTEGPAVVATGGGAFMNEQTRVLAKALGHVVWLRADLDTLASRCGRRDDRPLLRNGDMREILSRLIAERYPVYAQADSVIDSAEAPHEAVARAIMAQLAARGALD